MIEKTLTRPFYITTPIFYVNATPHIGHLYTALIADAISRWKQLTTNNGVCFSTGTDEHGIKIQQAAHKHKNTNVIDYCDGISRKYRELFDKTNVNYTRFIRTTETKHKQTVANVWNALEQRGHIYRTFYKGWYCVPDETFLTESQIREKRLPNGELIRVSAESGHTVEWTEEENFMFRLSGLQAQLERHLDDNPNFIRPNIFQKILLTNLKGKTLPDISISRSATRVKWGVQVPGDASQTIYVWLDALSSYLTVCDYPNLTETWPPDVQVLGKDILKFHGIYWLAFLIALDVALPKNLLVHSHWTVDGEKMSKSKGNVVDPFEKIPEFDEGLRYFLLREGVMHSDGNYSEKKLRNVVNSELADTLGNLLGRCTGSALNNAQNIPAIDLVTFKRLKTNATFAALIDKIDEIDRVVDFYEQYEFHKVADFAMTLLRMNNVMFEEMKPWVLVKDAHARLQLDVILGVTLETLRICGVILQPMIPTIAGKLLDRLDVDVDHRRWGYVRPFAWDCARQRKRLGAEGGVLFKRVVY